MRKKGLLILMISALALSACGTNNASNDSDYLSSQQNTSISSDSATSNSYGENMQYIKSNADYYGNGVIFGNDAAYFLDFDSMEKAPLCAVPNCTHDNSGCLAHTIGNTPIMYNNNIYYFNAITGVNEKSDGREFYIDSKFMKATIDSSETETITEFTDCMPCQPSCFLLAGNEVFFTADDMCPVQDEYGVISYSNTGGTHFLCSINLDTGEYTNYGSVYDGDKEYEFSQNSSGANITGYYNGKMYIQYVFMKEDPTTLGIPAEENWTEVNFEFDTESKELLESELPVAMYASDDIYAYLDDDSKQTIVITPDKTYTVPHYDLMSTSARVINDKIFFYDEWYDLSNMSRHGYGAYEGYEAVAYYNDSYIFINGGRNAKLTEEELQSL
ncbi:MAG: hypothetical protein Q4F95_02180 [Oscillospiraceae bacterium]|nr:hypothetical protein [Oscillospiraceae bacterium]